MQLTQGTLSCLEYFTWPLEQMKLVYNTLLLIVIPSAFDFSWSTETLSLAKLPLYNGAPLVLYGSPVLPRTISNVCDDKSVFDFPSWLIWINVSLT